MPVYLRPTGFVDAPFGHDGKVARLAGGLLWFSAVELLRVGEDNRLTSELVPVERIEQQLDAETRNMWENITRPRPPLTLGERVVRLDQPQVVGIVNVTPDSFSDGGVHADASAAIRAGHDMAAAGAAIVELGGESTRPGSKPVWEGDEVERVLPVARALAGAGTALSIDTRKAAVMEAAIGAGVRMINDVSALTFDERSAGVAAASGCPVVLMHHQGTPETMQQSPRYERPVLIEVYDWLKQRIEAAVSAGVDRSKIIVDPGIGFGKTVQHNLQMLNGLALLHGLGCPLMLGASRKRMIGALAGEAPADQRLPGSLALALKGADQGVQLLRVHDVPQTVQAVKVWRGLRDAALTPG